MTILAIIVCVFCAIAFYVSMANVKHAKDLNDRYSELKIAYQKNIDDFMKESRAFSMLCLYGYKDIRIFENSYCYRVSGFFEGKEFVIKMFTYPHNDEQEKDFARRQAEELKEIIEKF